MEIKNTKVNFDKGTFKLTGKVGKIPTMVTNPLLKLFKGEILKAGENLLKSWLGSMVAPQFNSIVSQVYPHSVNVYEDLWLNSGLIG